jgi:hypothetical protein
VEARLDVREALRRLVPAWLMYAASVAGWVIPAWTAWSQTTMMSELDQISQAPESFLLGQRLQVVLAPLDEVGPVVAVLLAIAVVGECGRVRPGRRGQASAWAGLATVVVLIALTIWVLLLASSSGIVPEEVRSTYLAETWARRGPLLVFLVAALWAFGVIALGRVPFLVPSTAVDEAPSATTLPQEPGPPAEPQPQPVLAELAPVEVAAVEVPPQEVARAQTAVAAVEVAAVEVAPAGDPWAAYRRPDRPT